MLLLLRDCCHSFQLRRNHESGQSAADKSNVPHVGFGERYERYINIFYLCYYIESTPAEVMKHAYLSFPVGFFFEFLNKSICALIERFHELLQSPGKTTTTQEKQNHILH